MIKEGPIEPNLAYQNLLFCYKKLVKIIFIINRKKADGAKRTQIADHLHAMQNNSPKKCKWIAY